MSYYTDRFAYWTARTIVAFSGSTNLKDSAFSHDKIENDHTSIHKPF